MWESWSSPLHPGRTKSNDSDCWIVLSSNLPPENTSELCLMWTQGAQGVTKNKVNKKNNKHSSFKFISKKKLAGLQGFTKCGTLPQPSTFPSLPMRPKRPFRICQGRESSTFPHAAHETTGLKDLWIGQPRWNHPIWQVVRNHGDRFRPLKILVVKHPFRMAELHGFHGW